MELKFLTEKRAEKQDKMQEILNLAKKEERAMNPDEIKAFNDCKNEIDEIDSTISAEEELRSMQLDNEKEAASLQTEPKESAEEKEERAFSSFVRGVKLENRANNLDLGSNGAVVPQTIANRIIEKVKDLCPIYSLSEIYNVKGTLVIPYYGEKSGEDVTCAYATEFTDLTSTAGQFTSVSLGSFLAGALTKVSKSLINKSQFNITSFIVDKVAASIAEFLEKELLTGTGTDACQGILTGATNVVTSATSGKITGDDLIDLQETIPDVYQSGAVFIMNKATRTAIRKLKDSDGNYMLNRDLSSAWGYTLLGKPVYTSDNMPIAAAGNKAVIYGNMSGFTVKLARDIEIQTLNELYAAQHALGVVGWIEVDSKITDQQKLAVLEVKEA